MITYMIIVIKKIFEKLKNVVIEANKEKKIIVKCEKCQKEHVVPIEELLGLSLNKSKTV